MKENTKNSSIYDLFGVLPEASDEVIRAAYNNLIKKIEPFKEKEPEKYKKMYTKIQQCYDILSNPERRKQYDVKLHKEDSEDTDSYKINDDTKCKEEITNSVLESDEEESEEDDDIVYKNLPTAILGTILLTVVMILVHKYADEEWPTIIAVLLMSLSAGVVVRFFVEKLVFYVTPGKMSKNGIESVEEISGGIFAILIFDYYRIANWFTKMLFCVFVLEILIAAVRFVVHKLDL